MSCSNDSACSLHLVDSHGRKEGAVMTVRKGISAFDYCRELNVIGQSPLVQRVERHWSVTIKVIHSKQLALKLRPMQLLFLRLP